MKQQENAAKAPDRPDRNGSDKTIQAYIAEQAEGIQPRLREIYETIRAAIPDAEERISWGMPTFWKGRNLIHFAAAKHHIGIYPGPEAVAAFADRLTAYRTSKGAVQFPNRQPLPLDLIAAMAQWCYENNRKR